MSNNKSFRVKYDENNQIDHIKIKLQHDFDFLNVLSLKITQEDVYKSYTSDYGVVIGRVLANDGFGIPNAKVSIFIKNQTPNQEIDKNIIYPYTSVTSKNNLDIRYNLLPSRSNDNCYQVVGTFPDKRKLLDNNVLIEVFNDYYKYTTVTNQSGDYMFFGVPTGQQQIHVDIDLSDIGVLSQLPSDMVYKGFSIKQFDGPNKFKKSTNLDSLPQIITENTSIFVYPFWGDQEEGEIAITKKNINLQYKFEPTCIFIGSIFTDSPNSHINKNCKPTKTSGKMSEMVSSQGSIEMIRETIDGNIERFDIDGGRVINNDGVWCYQIPMNLDYMITDEYGNLIPTTDIGKGIPTRTNVRFRVTLDDNGDDFTQSKTGMYLIPNNPKDGIKEDYNFDSSTKNTSFVNLLWNKVYSVKNYIPRIQRRAESSTGRNFIGLKSINFHENNNPAPYNNIWVNLNLRFMIMCFVSTFLIDLIGWLNTWIIGFLNYYILSNVRELSFISINKELIYECISSNETYESYEYFIPLNSNKYARKENFGTTRLGMYNKKYNTSYGRAESGVDVNSDGMLKINNTTITDEHVKVLYEYSGGWNGFAAYNNMSEDFKDCIETQVSIDNEVINFDFNNDWLNGSLYAPRFHTKTKRSRKSGIKNVKYCGSKSVNLELMQTCAPIITSNGDLSGNNNDCIGSSDLDKCYKKSASKNINEGILNKVDDLFYYKGNIFDNGATVHLMSTNIILLGSLNKNDLDGIPQLHQLLPSTSFKLPPDMADVEIITTGTTPSYSNLEISGVDWGLDSTRKNGLFVGITCMNSDTKLKSCVNASRLCEIGVDFDETYDYEIFNGTTQSVLADGYITLDEITDGDVRSMFATLNINNLSTIDNIHKHKKYNFSYNTPNGFDARLKSQTIGDVKSIDYYNFRFSNTPTSYISNQFHRYENSFYFYFGIKPGATAIDVFNNKYFVPCTDTDKDMFNVLVRKITDKDVYNNTLGSIGVSIADCTYPIDIYINDIIKVSNITNEDELIFSGLNDGYGVVKVIDFNGNVVKRDFLIRYIPYYDYSSEFGIGELEAFYNSEFTYTTLLPPQSTDYVNEEMDEEELPMP